MCVWRALNYGNLLQCFHVHEMRKSFSRPRPSFRQFNSCHGTKRWKIVCTKMCQLKADWESPESLYEGAIDWAWFVNDAKCELLKYLLKNVFQIRDTSLQFTLRLPSSSNPFYKTLSEVWVLNSIPEKAHNATKSIPDKLLMMLLTQISFVLRASLECLPNFPINAKAFFACRLPKSIWKLEAGCCTSSEHDNWIFALTGFNNDA